MPDLGGVAARLRYELGNGWRLLSSPWLERRVSVDECRSLFAASFGRNGWHHIRATLREFDANPAIGYRDTSLYAFLTTFVPTSISDFADTDGDVPLPLFVYPWGTFRKGEAATTKDPRTSRFCGPSTDQFVAEEFDRIIEMYKQLKSVGYRPYQYPHSFIGGTWLEASDGRRRFVVLQGNHRLAVLAHLGLEQIAVRPLRGWLSAVREMDIDDWMLVKSRRCSRVHARSIFNLFFHSDGSHLARVVPTASGL
jgi:hypothetical protein